MSIAILSAISLICVDAAMTPHAAAISVAALQSAPAIVESAETESDETVTDPEAGAAAVNLKDSANAEEASFGADAILSQDGPQPEDLAFYGESDEEVVARLRAYLEGIDTLTGEFTQIAPSGAVSSGKFYLRRPGLLRFEYAPPTPLLIVANGGLVYVRDEALETTDSYPVGKTPLKFLLQRKIDLEDAVVAGVDRGVDSVAVTFASSDDETEGELSVIVSAPEMTLKRWIVRDIENGITVVTLDNVMQGQKLASRLFRAPEAGGRFLDN